MIEQTSTSEALPNQERCFVGVSPVLKPFYDQDGITIYHGDCRGILPRIQADVMITDPPYGIAYNSGSRRTKIAKSIAGDKDTSVRDFAIETWGDKPALVFGTWRIPRPAATHTRLVWDTKGALGMGNLSVPWKPSDQEIYVLGYGFEGKRTSNVLTYAPVQSMSAGGRMHPHQKPVALLCDLIGKCPPGVIVDPFAGVCSTLLAAKIEGRRAIGIECEERYCEMGARRLEQGVLF